MKRPRKERQEPARHWCDAWFIVTDVTPPRWRFMDAIGSIEYDAEHKTWYANANNEYATVIRYCPFCGQDLWTEMPKGE